MTDPVRPSRSRWTEPDRLLAAALAGGFVQFGAMWTMGWGPALVLGLATAVTVLFWPDRTGDPGAADEEA